MVDAVRIPGYTRDPIASVVLAPDVDASLCVGNNVRGPEPNIIRDVVDTTMMDRTEKMPAVLRVRLIPWQGPAFAVGFRLPITIEIIQRI